MNPRREGRDRRRRSLPLLLCAAAQAAPQKAPSQKEISRELADLERDDQKDQNDPSWDAAHEREFLLRQKERRDRVVVIVAAGWLGSPEDFGRAALLLQHGQVP